MGRHITPGHEALWAFVRGCVVGMEEVLDNDEQARVLKVCGECLKELEEIKDLGVMEKKDVTALKRLMHMSGHAREEGLRFQT